MKALSPSGSNNLWSAVSMLVLATVAIALRFMIRISTRLHVTWSDTFMLLSLASFAVFGAFNIDYIVTGPGPGTYDLNAIVANYDNGGKEWGRALLKMLYVSDIFFGVTITFVKLSILTLYYSVFSVSRKFQLWTYVVGGACVIWFVVYAFLNIFQCRPIHQLWDSLGSTQFCLPSGKLWLGLELSNFFLDVVILVLPVAMLRQLQLPPTKKWSVAGIFLLGGLVCVASIVRLTFIWHPATPEVVNVADTQVLSSVQLGTAILCGCLPTYAPLLQAARRRVKRVKLALGMSVSETYRMGPNPGSGTLITKDTANRGLAASPYYRMDESSSLNREIQISKCDNDSLPLESFPSNSIVVHKSIHIT